MKQYHVAEYDDVRNCWFGTGYWVSEEEANEMVNQLKFNGIKYVKWNVECDMPSMPIRL